MTGEARVEVGRRAPSRWQRSAGGSAGLGDEWRRGSERGGGGGGNGGGVEHKVVGTATAAATSGSLRAAAVAG